MRIIKTNRLFKISTLIILLACFILVGLFIHKSYTSSKTKNKSTNITINNKPGNNQSNNTPVSQDVSDKGSSTQSANTPTESLSASINPTLNNGNLHIGTVVNGTTSGSCTLNAAQGDKSLFIGNAEISQSVNYYTCGVFNMATNNFPNNGPWTINLLVKSDSRIVNVKSVVNIP